MKVKICTKCGSSGSFAKCNKAKDKLDWWCRSCRTAARLKWKEKNPDKDKAAYIKRLKNPRLQKRKKVLRRLWHLKTTYNLSKEAWDLKFTEQNKCCAICKTKKPNGKGWHIDHNHISKKIRGILCHSCNSVLGFSKDNISILKTAILYLKKHYDS